MRAVAVILLALVLLAGCQADPKTTEDEEPVATEVRAAKVVVGALRPTLDLNGTFIVIPDKSALVSAPIGGQVSKILVQEGQSVKTGQSIALLDTRTTEVDLMRAKAALQEAEANLAMLKRGPLPQELEAARQEAKSVAATAQAQAAKLKALQQLHERAEISPVQYEQAQSAATGAEASSKSAAQKLALLESGTRPEALQMAAAKVAAAEADVAAQSLALELSNITAPIDGVVIELPVRLGMAVDRANLIARITDSTTLFARVRIPAQSRIQIAEGAKAVVSVDGPEEGTINGIIARIGKEAEVQTGDLDALVQVENPNRSLQPGLSCSVKILLPEIANALLVPVAAVSSRNGESVVTIIRDEKAFETIVEVGVRTAEEIQILKGLSEGELVATEGGYGLHEASPVKVLSESN